MDARIRSEVVRVYPIVIGNPTVSNVSGFSPTPHRACDFHRTRRSIVNISLEFNQSTIRVLFDLRLLDFSVTSQFTKLVELLHLAFIEIAVCFVLFHGLFTYGMYELVYWF